MSSARKSGYAFPLVPDYSINPASLDGQSILDTSIFSCISGSRCRDRDHITRRSRPVGNKGDRPKDTWSFLDALCIWDDTRIVGGRMIIFTASIAVLYPQHPQ